MRQFFILDLKRERLIFSPSFFWATAHRLLFSGFDWPPPRPKQRDSTQSSKGSNARGALKIISQWKGKHHCLEFVGFKIMDRNRSVKLRRVLLLILQAFRSSFVHLPTHTRRELHVSDTICSFLTTFLHSSSLSQLQLFFVTYTHKAFLFIMH